MSVTAASATATLTADEIIVETALGGLRYCLASFNKTVNLATTGAGGMDTGSAPTSGYVALYAIYNPTTQTAALLATNATSVVAPNVYGGANMPSGYTASGLISVWPTNSSGQFIAGLQTDRVLSCYSSSAGQALNSSVTQSSPTALSIASLVPKNAKYVTGNLQMSSTAASTENLGVYPTSFTFGVVGNLFAAAGSSATISQSFGRLPLGVQQTIYYTATNTAGTPSFQIIITGYEI
ncbi:phage tail protein [Burkholderia ubonensis]|nr:phage tail protein [Burkholderia ubonensis]